jgi:hypothetical protein
MEKRIRLNTYPTSEFGTSLEIASSRRTRATLGMASSSASGKCRLAEKESGLSEAEDVQRKLEARRFVLCAANALIDLAKTGYPMLVEDPQFAAV